MIDILLYAQYLNYAPLLTDYLLYFLIAMLSIFFYSIRNTSVLLEPWKKVIKRPLNVFVMLSLSMFMMVTTIDSIHFEVLPNHPLMKVYPNTYSVGQTKSVLDILMKEAVEHQEISYSAPFALYGFNKENQNKNNKVIRDYPRLLYSGNHLKADSMKKNDIIKKISYAAFFSALLIILTFTFVFMLTKKFKKNQRYHFPKKTFWFTLYFILFLICFVKITMPDYHIMGTSKIGEDVLYEAVKSIRTGVLIGTLTTLIMLPFAIFLGIFSGYFRGWVDDVIQYLYTTLSSIPGVLLIAASVLSLQILMAGHQEWFDSMIERSDIRLLALCVILGITSWTGLCRLLRAEALKLREIDYVMAARSLGVSHFKIMFKHLLPNMSHIILISIALDFSGLVLAEAVLSYMGVGVDPSSYSWGSMINGARLEMSRVPVVWWSLVASFIFMFSLVLSANIFADSLRDAFDPRMRDQQ